MVSVITTNYNYANYIGEAIISILNQTYKDFEYIIVDDGSTDNSESVIRNFSDSRIRYFKINHVGRSAALNFALNQSKFDIVALMDADDISHPQRLKKEIKKLTKKNQIIFCDSAYFINHKIVYVNLSPFKPTELKTKIILHGHLNNSSALFYKSFILENGGYDESLTVYEDYDLWMRLFIKCEFIVLREPLHFVRLHDKSLTTSDQRKNRSNLYLIQEKYFTILDSLDLSDEEKIKIRAFREFFFGNKKKCRKYFNKLKLSNFSLKGFFVFCLSFLPDNLLSFLINNRLRLRLEYLLRKNKDYKQLQLNFNNVCSTIYK